MAIGRLFDTNILIDDLFNDSLAAQEIESSADLVISVVTWMEVMVGPPASHLAATRDYLQQYEVIDLTDEIKERAVELRRTRRLKLPDAIILATAQVTGRVLVTRNTRDFRADEPGVRIPYSLPQ